MKLTFADIVDLSPINPPSLSRSLVKVLTANYERGAIPLSKITCDLKRTLKSVEAAWKEFNETRDAIIESFDAEDEAANKNLADGESKADWRTDGQKAQAWNAEFEVLMATEIDIHLTPQPEALIDQADGLKWSAADRARLDWFFEKAEEPKSATVTDIADHKTKEAVA